MKNLETVTTIRMCVWW